MLFFIKSLVADLRTDPKVIFTDDYSHQPGRLSQLSFGDPIFVHKQEGEWLFVSAIEQLQMKNKKWQPYPGWLHISEVSSLTQKEKRASFTKEIDKKALLKGSRYFLDLPYLWGGCSPSIKDRIASVDCSGLIYQLFKREGRLIPRDAHDQYLAAKILPHPEPGDLLFLTPFDKTNSNHKRITHVMILYDKEHYLEAPESGKKVRLLKRGSEIWQKNGLFHIFDREKLYFGHFGKM